MFAVLHLEACTNMQGMCSSIAIDRHYVVRPLILLSESNLVFPNKCRMLLRNENSKKLDMKSYNISQLGIKCGCLKGRTPSISKMPLTND